MSFNYFNITRPYHVLNLGNLDVGDYMPGVGFDMRDIALPKRVTLSCFENSSEFKIDPRDTPHIDTHYHEVSTEYSEAEFLHASFGAKFGIQSISAALDRIKSERTNSRSLYLIVEEKTGTTSLESLETNNIWDNFFTKYSEVKGEDLLNIFLFQFGSHYISNINHGWKLIIRVNVKTTDSNELSKFSGAFKAGIGSASAKGSLDQESATTLKTYQFETWASVIGKLSGSSGIIDNYSELQKFFQGKKTGDITVAEAPMEALLTTYSHLVILKSTELFNSLKEVQGQKNESLYGVPRGTIVAWNPDIENTGLKLGQFTLESIILDGWAICDGNNNTPNLTDKFIRGVTSYSALHSFGGKPSHSHTGSVPKSQINGNNARYDDGDYNAAGDNHGHHTVTINEAEHYPPYYSLIYIMKL